MCSVVMCPRSIVSSKVLALLRRCFSVSCCARPSPRVRPASDDRADRVDCQRQRPTRRSVPPVLLRTRSFQRTLPMTAVQAARSLPSPTREHAFSPVSHEFTRRDTTTGTCAYVHATHFSCTIYTSARFSPSNSRLVGYVCFKPHLYCTSQTGSFYSRFLSSFRTTRTVLSI